MKQCAVQTCESPSVKRGWCNPHYYRWKRHGDPEKTFTYHKVCIIEDCGQVPKSTRKGLCEKHRKRVRTHGNPYTVTDPRRPVVSYNTAHYRLRADRGSARTHSCVDCGNPAAHWSYSHTDPGELVSPEGYAYSLDQSYYDPRCLSCHNLFDHARADARAAQHMADAS